MAGCLPNNAAYVLILERAEVDELRAAVHAGGGALTALLGPAFAAAGVAAATVGPVVAVTDPRASHYSTVVLAAPM
jgi:hypothetical protein